MIVNELYVLLLLILVFMRSCSKLVLRLFWFFLLRYWFVLEILGLIKGIFGSYFCERRNVVILIEKFVVW